MSTFARIAAAVIAVALAGSLAGCAGTTAVPVGETQQVTVGVKTSDTFGKADMTVTGVDEIAAADAAAQGLTVAGFEDGVFFAVQIDLVMTEGNYEPSNTYSLGETFWSAEGSGDITPVALGYFDRPELDDCATVTAEATERLAAGETVSVCQLMVAEAGTQIDSVTFGKQLTRRSGEKWAWELDPQ